MEHPTHWWTVEVFNSIELKVAGRIDVRANTRDEAWAEVNKVRPEGARLGGIEQTCWHICRQRAN